MSRLRLLSQCELRCLQTKVPVDLNWSLMGNAGIGPVTLDMGAVWARARIIGHRVELSHEDTLLECMRHITQGHDFSGRMLRTCVDAEAIMTTCGADIDHSYIEWQAKKVECVRAIQQWLYFYQHVYGAATPHLPFQPFCSRFANREANAFSRAVLVPQIKFKANTGHTLSAWANAGLCVLSKLWCLDRPLRLCLLLSTILVPRGAYFSLIAGRRGGSKVIAIAGHAFKVFLFLPVLLLGAALMLLGPTRRDSRRV